MTTGAPASRHELQRKRDDAADWVLYARWTGIGAALIAIIYVLRVYGLTGLQTYLPILSLYALQGLLSLFLVPGERGWVARGLGSVAVAAIAIGILLHGPTGGILARVAVAFVCIRGAVASIRYGDYERRIKQTAAAAIQALDAS